jgi:hypothetical protein
MNRNHRRLSGTAGIAFGALLAPPLIALLASPLANADPVAGASVGTGDLTYTFGPDTLTFDPTTGGFDNYIQVSNFDFDVSMPADGTFGAVATGTSTHGPFQVGVQDVDGVLTHEFSTNPADFINPDWGLGELGGVSTDTVSAAANTGGGEVVTLGPFPIDGYTETLAYNSSTLALDNYLTGTFQGSAFDLDTFVGADGSNSFEVLLTDPGVFQVGVDDVDGSISYIDHFLGIDFIGTDPGLGDLLGI